MQVFMQRLQQLSQRNNWANATAEPMQQLIQRNSWPSAAAEPTQQLSQRNSCCSNVFPYSPDVEPRDCHVLDPLYEALRGRTFSSENDIKKAIQAWFQQQLRRLFSQGIKKLVKRLKKCVDLQERTIWRSDITVNFIC